MLLFSSICLECFLTLSSPLRVPPVLCKFNNNKEEGVSPSAVNDTSTHRMREKEREREEKEL